MTNQREPGQAGTELRDIEITPQMVEAGQKVLSAHGIQPGLFGSLSPNEIFEAMWAARPHPKPTEAQIQAGMDFLRAWDSGEDLTASYREAAYNMWRSQVLAVGPAKPTATPIVLSLPPNTILV